MPPTSDPFLDEVDAFLAAPQATTGAAGPDPFLDEVDAFLAQPAAPAGPSLGDRVMRGVEAVVNPAGPLIRAMNPGPIPAVPPAPAMFGEAPPPSPSGAAPPKTRAEQFADDVIGANNPVARGVVSGASSVVGGVGGIARAATDLGYLGPDASNFQRNPVGTMIRGAGEALSATDAAVQAAVPTPEQLAGSIRTKPQLLLEPAWWLRQGGQVMGSASPYMATLKGASLVGPELLEALTEGGNTYNDAIAAGQSPEEAARAAAGVAGANLAIVPGFNKVGSLIPSMAGRMAVEAGQEGAQEVAGNVAAGRPIGENVPDALLLGGLGATVMDHGESRSPIPARRQEAPRPVFAPAPSVAGSGPVTLPGAAPAAPPATTLPPRPSVAPSLPPATPPSNNQATAPDSLRQAIERELGGAVTEDELERLAGQAFTPSPAAGVEQTTPRAQAGPVPKPDPFLQQVDTFLASGGDTVSPGGAVSPQPKPFVRTAEGVPVEQPATPADARPWLQRIAEDAVAQGYPGDVDAAMDDAERRGRSLYDATHGQAANEGDDQALLERIRDAGGIALTDADLAGELRWLREFLDPSKVNTFAGVRNVFRRTKKVRAAEADFLRGQGKKAPTSAGLPIDTIVEAINEDARFAPRGLRGSRELLNALHEAAVNHREGRHQRQPFDPEHFGIGAGVRMNRRWWREGQALRRSDKLSPEGDAIQERFARQLEDDMEGAAARYRERFGTVIDADKVKELAGVDVSANHEALHAPSSHFADVLFERAVEQAPEPGLVAFTAGGPGSGKTTAVSNHDAIAGMLAASVVQRDSPLAKRDRAEEMLDLAEHYGHTPIVVYVYTDPVVAWQRAGSRGRQAKVAYHVQAHRGALETARALAERLGDRLIVMDNTGSQAVLLEDGTPMDILARIAQNYPSDADIRTRIASAGPEAAAAPAGGSPAAGPSVQGERRPGVPERRRAPRREAGSAAPAPPQVDTPGTTIKAKPARPITEDEDESPVTGRTNADEMAERPAHPSVSPALEPFLRRAWPNMQPERIEHAAPGVLVFHPDPAIGGSTFRIELTGEHQSIITITSSSKKAEKQLIGLKREAVHRLLKGKQGAAFRAAIMAAPVAKVDTLDTGEQQPRLPGDVGDVREKNQKPATFEAPFTLTGGIAPRKDEEEGTLFEPTGGRYRARGGTTIPARQVDEDRPALPATSDEEGSPTRRAFSEPPPVPPHVKPPRKPLSEVQVVGRLAEIFGHERRAGIARRLEGKIPIPIAGGVFGRPAYGFYSIRGQIIRLKKFGDLTTFSHELGHDLDYRIFEAEQPGWRALTKSKPIAAELKALGAATSPPSATAKYQRAEGVAEFFRVWFVDPTLAAKRAPAFAATFTKVLDNNTDLRKQFDEGRILVQQYLAQDHVQRGEARIDFGTKSVDDPDGTSTWQKAQALMVDDLVSLQDTVAHLAADKPVDVADSAYTLARLARGASAKAGGFLLHGVRDADGTFVSGSLKAALAPVVDDLKSFSAYLVARRAVELRARNIEPGMKAKEAEAILRKYSSPAFRAAAKAVYQFQDDVLSYATANGLLTPEQQQQIRALNQHYVPYWRVMKPDGAIGSKRMANRPSLIKRIRGSGRDLVDPLQAIVRNTHALVEAVEQHRAMVALVVQTQSTKGGDLFLEKIPTPQVKTTFNLADLTQEIRDVLAAGGVDVSSGFTGQGTPALFIGDEAVDLNELVSVFTPATMATGKNRVISVMHAGQRTFFRVTDPALFEALTAIGPKATNQATRWAFKVLGAPARTLRAGATLTLGFVGRNVVRDSWVAAIQSRHGFVPGIDTLRGLYSYLKADEHYQQFVNAGAGNAAMVAQDRNAIARELRQLTSKGRLRDHAASVVFHPIDFLRALSEASEHATRVGQFRRAHDRGASLAEAALSARDVTVDFARGGSFTKDANQFVAFFNARIQGYARLAETFRDNPVGASIRTATSVTLLSLALWALNHDDDEYAELPEWERNTYWHLPIAWLPRLLGGDRLEGHHGYLRIPKPFELGTLFGTVFERAMDQVTGHDPHAWKRLFVDDPTASAGEVAAEAAKQGAWETVASLVPTALLPMLEAAMNYSTFRQRPIVSPFDKDLPAELQYNRWTSETAKAIGGALDISPALIDHLVYSYGAGLARGVISDAIDPAIATLGGKDRPPIPSRPLQAMPGAGAFVRDAAGTDAQSIAELYALRDRLRAVPGTVKRYQAEGSDDKARAFAERFPDRLAQQRRVNHAAEDLKDLRDRMSAVYAHPELTPSEKRELLDRTLEDMVNVARKGLGKAALPSRFKEPLSADLARRVRTKPASPIRGR